MNKLKELIKKDWLIIILLIASFVIGISFYPKLPDRVPVHWNIKGEANGYGGKFFGAFGIPFVTTGVYIFFLVLPYIDPKRKNYQSFSSAYQVFKYTLVIFMVGLHSVALLIAAGHQLNITLYVQIALSLLFIFIGNVMGRIKHNYFVGVKTPWTLANEEVWRRTHRFSAPIWVAGGVINLFLAIFLTKYIWIGLIVILMAISILPIVYSYIIYRKLDTK